VGNDSGTQPVSSAETIERLVDRVSSSTLLEDRRDACRALKAMSKKFRLEVGAQGLTSLITVLKTDQSDSEIISYVLETFANIFSPEEFEEEVIPEKQRDDFTGVGEGFSEMFLKEEENLPLLLEFLGEFDFKIRRPVVAAVSSLLTNCPREIQKQILNSHTGVSRLMDILGDTREVLRNDSLILLFKLTKGNSNIQKIVAFENAFDKLMEIMEFEGWTDGGIVVEDCLRLMLNLLRNNPSNQTFFKEGSYIARLLPSLGDPETKEYGWDAQKVSNMLHILQLIRTLVAPSNPGQITTACQLSCRQSGVLEQLEEVLLASGIPADVLTESINTIAELIRGNNDNQAQFSGVSAPSEPPRSVLVLLLMSMVNEKQPFSLRCSVLYCVQSFLYKNSVGQSIIVESLLPKEEQTGDISSGQLLCAGLFSNDPTSNWLCAIAMAQVISESLKLKDELLRVQLATQGGNAPVPLLVQCCHLLQQNSSLTTRLGLLQLICVWVASCPTAVACLLQVEGAIAFFMAQICSNEHDETERLGHGLCAFLLGLCMLYNNNSVSGATQQDLLTLVEKRVGSDLFLDKIADIPKHESFNKALKSPQLRCLNINELIVDNMFCQMFRTLDRDVTNIIGNHKAETVTSNSMPLDASTQAALENYKTFIRDQDSKMKEYVDANQLLHTEYTTLQARFEELNSVVQQLRDQNAILQAQAMNAVTTTKMVNDSGHEVELEKDAQLEQIRKNLEQREEYILELEARLTAEDSVSEDPTSLVNETSSRANVVNNESQTDSDHKALTAEALRVQLESMRDKIMKKDEELIKLKNSMPLYPEQNANRNDTMFMTTLELESRNPKGVVTEFSLQLELKEKEITRLKEQHDQDLKDISNERDELEMKLFKVKHELDEARENVAKNSNSSDKTDLLERRLRDLTAEVDELKEERDRKMTAVNSQLHEQNGVINKLNVELGNTQESLKNVQSEQLDLLVMLADQEEKLLKYKTKLREFNVVVSEEEDAEEEDDLT